MPKPDNRQRDLAIHDDRLRGGTFDAVGKRHGVTKERVRQIVLKVQRRLRYAARYPLSPLTPESYRPELYGRWIEWTADVDLPRVGTKGDEIIPASLYLITFSNGERQEFWAFDVLEAHERAAAWVRACRPKRFLYVAKTTKGRR